MFNKSILLFIVQPRSQSQNAKILNNSKIYSISYFNFITKLFINIRFQLIPLLIGALCTNVLDVYVSLRIILKKSPTFETYFIMIVTQVWAYTTMLPIFLAVFNATAINNLVREIFISFAFVTNKKMFNYFA